MQQRGHPTFQITCRLALVRFLQKPERWLAPRSLRTHAARRSDAFGCWAALGGLSDTLQEQRLAATWAAQFWLGGNG